jgi:hypothetical protein
MLTTPADGERRRPVERRHQARAPCVVDPPARQNRLIYRRALLAQNCPTFRPCARKKSLTKKSIKKGASLGARGRSPTAAAVSPTPAAKAKDTLLAFPVPARRRRRRMASASSLVARRFAVQFAAARRSTMGRRLRSAWPAIRWPSLGTWVARPRTPVPRRRTACTILPAPAFAHPLKPNSGYLRLGRGRKPRLQHVCGAHRVNLTDLE